MKKHVLFCLVFLFCITFQSFSAPAKDRGNDIWSLLQRGDPKARDFFVSEVDVNAKDLQGRTPLHYAAENKDTQLAGFLLAIGANPNVLDNSGQSPLVISIENNDPEICALLVAANANIHLPIRETTGAALALGKEPFVFKSILTSASVETVDNNGRTVLHLASIAGNVNAVYDILSAARAASTLINKNDDANKNALDYVLERPDSKNHMVIAEQLILAGGASESVIFSYLAPAARSANYDIVRNGGIALIHYAAINNYSGLILFLFDKKIDVNIKTTSGATALHEAVRSGNIQLVSLLLDNGADVNSRDAKGNTPLHIGIPSHVHREVVTLLLSKGADPNLRDEHGETPLHIAITLNRSLDIIQAILNGGSNVNIRNIEGKTPLYIAIQERRESLIPVLLTYGCEVFAADNSGITPFDLALRTNGNIFNLLVTSETVNQRDSAGNTMLHIAVRNHGTPLQINRILSEQTIVDTRNREGDTALHIAVRTNQRENAEFLISRNADIFSVNAAGDSPLYLAFCAPGGIREWIINYNTIFAKDSFGNNMLHYAAQWRINNVIPVIIRNGLPVDEANTMGETPLFMAIKMDSPSTIRVFLENKANLNIRDIQGNSTLHAAVRWNARNSVSLILSNEVDINAFNLNGNTPLHDSITLGMSEIETMLIREGANLEVRNIDGNTPFMEAVRAGNLSSMENLAKNRADINTRNARGDTPLHIAVGMERIDSVNLLLGYGSSIHALNTRNRTPFQISLSVSPRMVTTLLANNRIHTSDDMGDSVLHIALQEKVSDDTLRTILSSGARINAVDNNGKTPLRLAVDLEYWSSIKILADAGADPYIAAVDNKSPAEIAFEKGEQCIRALFSGRAINAKDSSENTILHFAARHGNPQLINILIGFGASKNTRNILSEIPYDIAVRWNRRDNADLLR